MAHMNGFHHYGDCSICMGDLLLAIGSRGDMRPSEVISIRAVGISVGSGVIVRGVPESLRSIFTGEILMG